MVKRTCCGYGLALTLVLAALAGSARAEEKAVAQTVTMAELEQLVGGPTLVTLRFKKAPPKAVFAELARQAKVPIDASDLDPQSGKSLAPIATDFVRQPFWIVLRSLCARLDADIDTNGRSITLVLRGARSLETGPASDHGMVLFVADNTTRSVNIDYSAPEGGQQETDLSLLTLLDPKLRLLTNLPSLHLNRAVDEKGQPVFEPMTSGEGEGYGFGFYAQNDFSSEGKPSDSRRLALVQGTGKLFVGFNVQRWEVANVPPAKNVVKTVNRATGVSQYVLRDVEATENSYIVHLTISKREFDLQDQSAIEADFDQRVHLYDAQGNELSHVQFGAKVGDDTDPVSLTVPFERPNDAHDKPAKLVVEIPDVRAVEVPFEFKDLPLP